MQIGTVVEMPEGLDWDRDGALLFPGVLDASTRDALSAIETPGPGRRLRLSGLAARLAPVTAIAQRLIGLAAFPVRAVLFDKSVDNNWALGWHQDRTITVRSRRETPGFGPWTTKDGLTHVAPPQAVLEGMVTLRAHLDPCPADNAPLLVALGSHQLGRIPADQAATIAERGPRLACLAEAGDVWAYATPILHASERSAAAGRRRVLQVDYAAQALPDGLEWLGIEP